MARLRVVIRALGAAIAALAGWSTGIGVLAWATRGVLARAREGPTFDSLFGLAAAGGAWCALLWLGIGFAVAMLSALPKAADTGWDRLARRIAPASARRVARLLVGAVIAAGGVAGTAVPASADTASPATPTPSRLPDLDRPAATAPPMTSAGQATPTSSRGGSTGSPTPALDQAVTPDATTPKPPNDQDRAAVTVVSGDTLWGIAAARLGPAPANAEIAAEWPRWYERNREVIGSDPDLILPGQRLSPPD